MVGPKKQDFWPTINILKGFLKKILLMNDSLTKSAKIVLSKSIFDVKNRWNFLIFFHWRILIYYLGDHFLLKTFFSRLNFRTTLLSKIRPNFCRPHTMSIHKIQQFHLTTVEKTLLFGTHQARNSMT